MDPRPILTLNPRRKFAGTQHKKGWRHHTMDVWHLALMLEGLPRLQGQGHLWYAGEWVTFAGHWPTIKTGVRAACSIIDTTPREIPADAECKQIHMQDQMDWMNRPAVSMKVCGEAGIFNYMLETDCKIKLPEHLSYSKIDPTALAIAQMKAKWGKNKNE